MPGGQTLHQQQVDEQVDVAGRGLAIDTQVACQLRQVERLPLMVAEHGPEAAQRLGGDARSELRDVAFEVGQYEVLAPAQARSVAVGEEALGKAATQPKALGVVDLSDSERGQFQMADAPRQTLAGPLQQIERSRTQEQIETAAVAWLAGTVDQAPQNRKKSGSPVDLIENDEPVEQVGKIQSGLGQSGPVPRRFQIEVEGGNDCLISRARVVLPDWRGPSKTTAACFAKSLVQKI